MEEFGPFKAGKNQGRIYNESAKGNRNHKLGQPYMSVFGAFINGLGKEEAGTTGLLEEEAKWASAFAESLKVPTDVGKWVEVWTMKEARDPTAAHKKRTVVKYRLRDTQGMMEEESKTAEKLAQVLRKAMLHLKGQEQHGPAPPTNNERELQSRLTDRRAARDGKYAEAD